MTTASELTAINVLLEEIKGILRNSNLKQAEILEEQITDIAVIIAGL